MKLAEVKSIIQIVILIITNGKVVVEAIGDIVEEIKSWFRKEGPEPKELDQPTLKEIVQRVSPLMAAVKGKVVPVRKVEKAARIMWKANPETVRKLTKRKVGKTSRRS